MGRTGFLPKQKLRVITKDLLTARFSFESIHWNHPTRAADILISSNWDDRKNDQGYAGASFSPGVAGHGGISPYEVHIALMASGPSFKKPFIDSLPTSNVDIVPTVFAYSSSACACDDGGQGYYGIVE